MTAVTLHPLVTELHRPNQSSVEILEERISSARWQATLYQTATVVCAVAFVAILAVVLATSYQFLVLSEINSLVVAGSALLSPVLLLGPAKFSQLNTYYSNLADDETQSLLKLREIADWNQAEVENFFRQEGLQIERLPLRSLQQISPHTPHKTLLPLIARFQALKEKTTTIFEAARRALAYQEEHWREQERQGNRVSSLQKQRIRFESTCVHHDQLERIAMPAALQAATLLQLIQNPTLTDLTPDSQEIIGVGRWIPRSYPERAFAKTAPDYDDSYFHFLPEIDRPSLTHTRIEREELNPARLRLLLYPSG